MCSLFYNNNNHFRFNILIDNRLISNEADGNAPAKRRRLDMKSYSKLNTISTDLELEEAVNSSGTLATSTIGFRDPNKLSNW